jgi:sulfiredoxin
MKVQALPLTQIRRPLPRKNDPAKVEALMQSIKEIGVQEPIDVLEVDGEYYGFSGCHRYEACQRLGLETIPCKIRKAPRSVLKMHLA